MPEPIQLSPRLRELFSKTKLVCFGRYALEVPQEAQLIWGSASFPSKIEVFSGSLNASKLRVENDIANLKLKSKTAEITYSQEGPIANSWQIRYYENQYDKSEGLHFFDTYINKGDLTFILGGAVEDGETEDVAASREALRAKSLRLRAPDEIPAEPGYCIEHGFFDSMLYNDQEMVNVGIFLPSLPDVSLSVSSNKDAYADYSPDEFEQTERHELSLLARIQQAKDDQGIHYPSRTVLREGKRDVQHWHGEESLIKRKDGTHDFEWALVGKPKDVANPSEFGVQMYTKVEHNTVGAAKAASLSDDEAVALWDKVLSGLKFRVKVPGAPQGSYYFPKPSQQGGGTK
ncbi:T6SS immunity protein Tli4 family protein [Massilia horti]|uniref:T6SS immunity protein Tli4 family protein n=1 Tax=Massilia horti TaxID=2562153 RepID=UPI001431665D|nr:T6SS immunity protein Tli4 family protein [Massilia horti]